MAFEFLNVALFEHDIVSGDKQSNVNGLCIKAKPYADTVDLIAVPELFTTGFVNDKAAAYAASERNTEFTMNCMHDLSKQLNSAVCGSFLAHTASRIYNRAFFVEPNGEDVFYDKRHLFGIGGETKVFSAGSDAAPVVRFRGWNIKVVICYDLRFPVFCRNRGNEYDLLVVVANWPEPRHNAWMKLLAARAIENSCYVCGVNRRGCDALHNCYGSGSSAIFDYKGEIIAQTTPSSAICTASLSRAKLQDFRRKFPVSDDADEFVIR